MQESALTSGESNDIYLSHIGVAGESNAIRIGTTGVQTNAYIAGIYNTMPGGTIQNVIVNKQRSFRINSVFKWLEFTK